MGNNPVGGVDPDGGWTDPISTFNLAEGITVTASRLSSMSLGNIAAAFGSSLLSNTFIKPLDDYLRQADGSLKLIRKTDDDFNRVYEQDGSVANYNKDGTLINKWLPEMEIGSRSHSQDPMLVPTYLLHNVVMGTFLAAVGGGAGNAGRGLRASRVLRYSKTAKGGLQYSDDLVKAAQKLYPNKAGLTELHHITPKYLGGAPNGPLVPLNGSYHQQITNAFRQAWAYGKGPITDPVLRRQIMNQVYKQFPLPPGFTY
jgi:hypothetical protein